MAHCVGVCLLWQLPVAKFGWQKVLVTHLCTFDCHFRMADLGEGSDGRLLLSVAEAMLGVFSGGVSRVIYRRTYLGIVFRSLIFET